jgi:hypothetical protein
LFVVCFFGFLIIPHTMFVGCLFAFLIISITYISFSVGLSACLNLPNFCAATTTKNQNTRSRSTGINPESFIQQTTFISFTLLPIKPPPHHSKCKRNQTHTTPHRLLLLFVLLLLSMSFIPFGVVVVHSFIISKNIHHHCSCIHSHSFIHPHAFS